MTSSLQAPLETLALASLREDPELRALLQDGYDAYLKLQSAASLARTPERFLDHTFAWDDWDHTLRACVRRLGPALLRACIERAPIQGQAAPSVLPQVPQTAPPSFAQPPEATPDVAATSEPAPSAEPVREGAQEERKPVTVSDSYLRALQKNLKQGGIKEEYVEPQERAAVRRQVREAFALLDKPTPSLVAQRLDRWCSRDELQGVTFWGKKEMHAWLSALAALTQYVRHDASGRGWGNKAWSNLDALRKQSKLDYIHGLAARHEPKRGGWLQDARWWLEQLDGWTRVGVEPAEVEMGASEAQREVEGLLERWEESKDDPSRPAVDLSREMEALLARGLRPNPCILRRLSAWESDLVGSELSPLRDKIRKQRKDDEAEEEQSVGRLPSDWPYWPLVRGRVAVMLGSEGKATQLEAIQEAFEFERIEHIAARRGERKAQALAASIKKDDPRVFLMMYRYMSHNTSERIWECKDHAFLYGVEAGFGVGAVLRAIEKHGPGYLKRLEEES